MGHADGFPPPQDPGRLPRLSRGRPRRASHTTTTMSAGEPDATEIGHVRFGGGPSEKALLSRDLAGGLPNRTPGSASGLGKRAGSNPCIAPQADSPVKLVLDRPVAAD